MNIIRKNVEYVELQAFLDDHKLTITIEERSRKDIKERCVKRYMCYVENIHTNYKRPELLADHVIRGSGWTELDALIDYATKISGETVRFRQIRESAGSDINVPHLTISNIPEISDHDGRLYGKSSAEPDMRKEE